MFMNSDLSLSRQFLLFKLRNVGNLRKQEKLQIILSLFSAICKKH